MKPIIEGQRRYLLAGDSAYPISGVLIKPYTNEEALTNERKRLFNARLSGLRTVMSENVFGIWKKRFPCLNNIHCFHPNAKKTIYATGVLHNLSILWNDEDPDEDYVDGIDELPDVEEYIVDEDDADIGTIRERGQILRDNLCARMPEKMRREHVA